MDCELCKRESIEKPAGFYCNDCEERMCEDCSKHHRKNKLTLRHSLVHVSVAGGTDSQGNRRLKELNTFCTVHAGTVLEYLCQDHNSLCCPYCVIETHRTCKKVITFADYKRSAEFANKGLQMQEMIENVSRKADYVTQVCQEFIGQVNQKDNEFETWLQDVLSQIATKIRTISEEKNISVSAVETVKGEMFKQKTLQQTRELFDQAKNCGTLQEEIVALQRVSDVLKQTDTGVQSGLKFVHSLSFRVVDLTMESVFQAIEKHIKIVKVGLTTGVLSFHTAIKIEHLKHIRNCAFIADDIVICLSHHENVAVAYNIRSKLFIASITLRNEPMGLAKRSNNSVLITLPFSKQIATITVNGPEWNTAYVKTEASFYCVTPCPSKGEGTFLATSKETRNFYFITWEGKQLQEIETLPGLSLLPEISNKIVPYVDDISMDSKSGLIFASSTKMNRLLVFSDTGSFKCSFSIDNPMGLTNGPCGFTLACSYGSHQIHEIKIDGNTQNRIVLTHKDGLTGPLDVAYNSDTRQLAICEMDKGRELKVFDVQLPF